MKSEIKLAPGLSFPAAEFATEVVASLGARGGGKSNGAAVVAEGLLDAGVQVIVLDYVGIWFSLRLEPDGKTPSRFKIAVLGGSHGDIGLASTAGATVAEALAISGASAILDISGFSKGDRCRFATDFAEAFFAAKKKHPGPVQLLLEEAQRFVPQKLFTGQERMLGAFEEIGEVGRNYGIGLHLISQRPQKINKDVLNLADTVLGYRTLGVLERKAIGEWVQEKGAAGRERVQDELPSLKVGNAIAWCPSRDLYGKYAIRKKSTYDAGATPVRARAAVQTKPLDLGELENAMGKAVEEAKANDPRALKAEIARLQKELSKSTGKPPEVVAGKTVDVPFVPPEWRAAVAKAREQTAFISVALERATDATRDAIVGLEKCEGALPPMPERRTFTPAPRLTKPALAVRTQISERVDVRIGIGEHKILTACAQHGEKGVTREQLTVLTGYKRSTRDAYIQRLRVAGHIEEDCGAILATEAGVAVLGPDFEPLPTGAALLAYWLHKLPEGERACLQVVVDAYPDPVEREAIGEATGYKRSTRDAYLQRLRSRRLIVDGHHGQIWASAELFG